MIKPIFLVYCAAGVITLSSCSQSSSPESQASSQSVQLDAIHSYLVSTVERMKGAADSFVMHAEAYDAALAKHNLDYKAAAKDPEVLALVTSMQEDYKQMDSFGYETVEGIVAGVPSLAQYDVDLDAGNKSEDGPEDVAQITLTLSDGTVIDKEGNLFTHIIEPALWGGAAKWIVPVDVDGDGKIENRESLPKAELLIAASKEAQSRIGNLVVDCKAWTPTLEDCFGAMITMTPTLSDYFEDWKESRYSDEQSGKFFAVSRVSDMRGIMGSCAVMYKEVNSAVAEKDPALAEAIATGFSNLDSFLIDLQDKEKGNAIQGAEIDEYATQAKDKTDKLVPQIEQAAALLNVQPNA